jgi:hypothetical protein
LVTPSGQYSHTFAKLALFKKLAMFLRKSWIVLLLYFTFQVTSLSAKQRLTAHEEVCNDTANNALLSTEDLVQLFGKKLPKSKFTQWLLNLLVTHPQALQDKLTIASYLPYDGHTIGLIQLDKQGALRADTVAWKHLASMILPTTKDWVILAQLSFVPGDIIVPQKLMASQERLNKLLHIKKVTFTVKEREDSSHTVDVYITIKDRFPITPGLDADKPGVSITHNNLFGWGHLLQNKFLYDQGLGYSITYSVPNTKRSGGIGRLQYLHTQKKSIKKLLIRKTFTDQTNYAGKIEATKTRKVEWRILDGNASPQTTTFSFYYQCVWLGTAFNIYPSDDRHEGRLFLTGKLTHQHYFQRPEVTKSANRYFHHRVFGAGSLGFANKRHYKDQLVYGVGSVEIIPYGRKVNITGGYQFGEFVNRPYLRLDIAQGRRTRQLGHLYSAASIGGYWYKKAVEQGILQLQLGYFTPLLGMGNQWIRQFIRLNYLAGYNMFTGELISTNINKVSASFRDPFVGGTQRFHLGFETVLLMPMHFAGCQVAALGFVDAVRLQDAQGKVQQNSFCKALGIGFRCAHPRFSFGTLQAKVGYSPLTQNMNFTINMTASPSDDLDIGEPGVILFQEY